MVASAFEIAPRPTHVSEVNGEEYVAAHKMLPKVEERSDREI